MIYERECLHCGKMFTTTDKSRLICSHECRVGRKRHIANAKVLDYCVVCGKPFEKARYSVKTTCCDECRKTLCDNTRTEKKAKADSIAYINHEARKNGMTYGKYQAQKFLAEMRAVQW